MECYSLNRYVNCVSPERKNTSPPWIDTFPPLSYIRLAVWSSFKFQKKVGKVWNYQVKSKKLQTFLHRLFWLAHCNKLEALCIETACAGKISNINRASRSSRIKSFSFSSVKKVGGAARFSFHICRYIKEMIMLYDLLLL